VRFLWCMLQGRLWIQWRLSVGCERLVTSSSGIEHESILRSSCAVAVFIDFLRPLEPTRTSLRLYSSLSGAARLEGDELRRCMHCCRAYSFADFSLAYHAGNEKCITRLPALEAQRLHMKRQLDRVVNCAMSPVTNQVTAV
jgi:hypothetical protein